MLAALRGRQRSLPSIATALLLYKTASPPPRSGGGGVPTLQLLGLSTTTTPCCNTHCCPHGVMPQGHCALARTQLQHLSSTTGRFLVLDTARLAQACCFLPCTTTPQLHATTHSTLPLPLHPLFAAWHLTLGGDAAAPYLCPTLGWHVVLSLCSGHIHTCAAPTRNT